MARLSDAPAAAPARGNDTEAVRTRMIVDAAYELLDEAGLQGLTIRAVLKRTGLARRAFYERFAGKDDLVLAVFEQTLSDAADHFRKQAESLTDPLKAIRAIVDGIVLGGFGTHSDIGQWSDRRSAALSREHLRLAEARPAELQAALSPLIDLIAEQVRAGVRTGQFRSCEPELQARLIYNLIATTVHTELIAEENGRSDREGRRRLAEEIWEFCRRAIVA